MNSSAELFRALPWLRASALALIAISAAGCSAETARFGDPRSGQGEVTGSIPSGQGAPVGHVETQPLPQTSQLPPPQSSARAAPVASPVVAGGGRGMASYRPPISATPASYN